MATDSKHPTVSVLFKPKVKGKLSFRKVRCQERKVSGQNIFLGLYSNKNMLSQFRDVWL